jgi:hypothetical protein
MTHWTYDIENSGLQIFAGDHPMIDLCSPENGDHTLTVSDRGSVKLTAEQYQLALQYWRDNDRSSVLKLFQLVNAQDSICAGDTLHKISRTACKNPAYDVVTSGATYMRAQCRSCHGLVASYWS